MRRLLINVAISLAVFVVFAAVLEAMRRRGFDPVASLANLVTPSEAGIPEEM